MAHSERRVTFVGEEAGGAYLGNTSGFEAEVVLPNSGLVLYLPLVGYYLAATEDVDPRHGVVPDYPVAPTIEDLIAGRDPVWEKGFALALSRVNEAGRDAGISDARQRPSAARWSRWRR